MPQCSGLLSPTSFCLLQVFSWEALHLQCLVSLQHFFLPLFYILPFLTYRIPLQQSKVWPNWHLCALQSGGVRKCAMWTIHLCKMASLCKIASLRPYSVSQKLKFLSTLVIPKQVLCLCGKLELQSYLIHSSLNAKWDDSGLPTKCCFFW